MWDSWGSVWNHRLYPALLASNSFLVSSQGVYERCEVLLRAPFATCHAFVSPLPFMASCTSDLCQ